MTPKEKAKDLFNRFSNLKTDYEYCVTYQTTKEISLIAVDEILDTLKRNSTEFRGCMDFQLIAWWKEVKQEINNL